MKKTIVAVTVFFASFLAAASFADEINVGAQTQMPQEQETSLQEPQPDGAESENAVEPAVQPSEKPDIEPQKCIKEPKEEKKRDDKIHPYVRADAGITYTSFDVDYESATKQLSGMQAMYNIGAGIKYKKGRFELAYQKRATMSDVLLLLVNTSAWVDNRAIMANAFYDFVSTKYFALYIGGGAGVNMWETELKWSGNKYTDSGTSYTAGAYLGASINTPIGFSVDFGLDYYYVNKPMMNSVVPKIGVRLTF